MLLLLALPAFARDFLQVDAGAPGMAVQVNVLREGGGFTGSEVLTSDCADLTIVTTSALDRGADPAAPLAGTVLQAVIFVDVAATPATCHLSIDGTPVDPYGDGIDNAFDIVSPVTLSDGGPGDVDGAVNSTILLAASWRTDGGTIVLDSLSVPAGTTLAFDTSDPDAGTAGNEAFLPVIVLVDGDADLAGAIDVGGADASDAPVANASDGGDGAPGGGGGGVGSNCIGPADYLPGDGFTGGGGTETGTCIKYTEGGVGAAEGADGADGGEGIFTTVDDAALGYAGGVGGGTGVSWGTGGGGGYCCGVASDGGFGGGGGNGHSDTTGWGGGGGGFGTAGENGIGTVGGGAISYTVGGAGKASGDGSLVPLNGGSGGAGGDSGSGTADGAGGGGGGGAFLLFANTLRIEPTAFLDVSGGDGGDTVGTNPGSSTGGAGGSGGGVLLAGWSVSGVDAAGLDLTGGHGGHELYGYYSGDGGEGRLRIDGAEPPALATGPSGGTATTWEGAAFTQVDLFDTRVSSSGTVTVQIFDATGAMTNEVALAEDGTVELWRYLEPGTNLLVVVDDTTGVVGPAGAATITFTPDADGDGYDDPAFDGDDCDDSDPDVHPGAVELCDGIDNNCDGSIDEAGGTEWYGDADGDGFGGASVVVACDQPEGYVADSSDCDDTNAAVNPDAEEVCDGIDNDCDGEVDEAGGTEWYGDADGDGFGGTDVVTACDQPEGYVDNADDCDDTNAAVNPDADEVCDGIDNDCDGDVDEAGGTAWYGDADGDTYGAGDAVIACDQPEGYVADSSDCDDTDAAVNPGAAEICDGIDNDCDGEIDEAGGTEWYGDADGDGFGGTSVVVACEQPEGHVDNADDCDDTDPAVNPDAAEVCDGIDNDCDGAIDEDGGTAWYEDTDGDGYGDGEAVIACDPPDGYVAQDGDCNDEDSAYHPGATEDDCTDPNDYNCDGSVGYEDADGDGSAACEDCDDADGASHPGADEVCDDVDNDCDGEVDEDAIDQTGVWTDADGDGYGGTWYEGCELPTNVAEDDSDCDDTNAAIHPGATDIPDDGVDQDCVDGDAVGDEGEVGKDTGGNYQGGCGCAATPSSGIGVTLLLALGLLRRR